MKIVHIPTDLGMRAVSLSGVERLLGHSSEVIVRKSSVHVSGLVRDIYSSYTVVFAIRIFFALLKLLRSDLIMLNAGSSLLDFGYRGMELMDLALYKKCNKRIITTFQGCDARMCLDCPVRAALPSDVMCINVPQGLSYQGVDAIKKRRIKKLSDVSYKLLGITPDICKSDSRIQYSPHVKNFELLGSRMRKIIPLSPNIRIGHMPKKHHKGTEYIENVLYRLQSDYPGKFNYVPITGVSWDKALSLVASCDLLIDQVLTGWYGGISVEAAYFGVPSLCYIDSDLLQYVPKEMANELPVIVIEHKNALYEVLKHYIKNPEVLINEGKRCRNNSIKHHDPIKITCNILS